MAMRAAAPPPTALNSDTSWGIAVIFTVFAVYRPAPPPTAMPTAMMSQPVGATAPLNASRTAVPPIARAMPPADNRLPFRAVAGEFMRIRPMTNDAAPRSQAIRTRTSMPSIGQAPAFSDGVDGVDGPAAAGGAGAVGLFLNIWSIRSVTT